MWQKICFENGGNMANKGKTKKKAYTAPELKTTKVEFLASTTSTPVTPSEYGPYREAPRR